MNLVSRTQPNGQMIAVNPDSVVFCQEVPTLTPTRTRVVCRDRTFFAAGTLDDVTVDAPGPLGLHTLTQFDGPTLRINANAVIFCRQTPHAASTTQIFLLGNKELIVQGSLAEIQTILMSNP